MTEKIIDYMDENLETTKNESRDSVIGFLQIMAVRAYPSLAVKHPDSFFWKKEYFAGEKVDENGLQNGIIEFEQIRQNNNKKEDIVIQKAA